MLLKVIVMSMSGGPDCECGSIVSCSITLPDGDKFGTHLLLTATFSACFSVE